MGGNIGIPDTSQLPLQSPERQFNLENTAAAFTPQVAPPPPFTADQSIQDLESRIGQTPPASFQQRGQLEDLQQQLTQPQFQQPNPNDPFEQVKNQIAQQMAQRQPAQPQQHGPMRNLLTNFLHGAGEAMMAHYGVPLPSQLQQRDLGNLLEIDNQQSLSQLRQAQMADYQRRARLVDRTLPDGSVVQVPLEHAATLDASLAKIMGQEQKPVDPYEILKQAYGAAVIRDMTNGLSGPAPDTLKMSAKLREMQGTLKPAADTGTAEKQEFRDIIQPAITAGEITNDALLDVRKLTSQIGKSKTIPADQKAKAISWLASNSTPASTGANVNIRVANEAAKSAGKPYFAFDPATNQRVQTTPDEAAEKGYTNLVPVKEGDIEKNRTAAAQFIDVQSNLSRYKTAVRDAMQNGLTAGDGPLIDTIINKSGIADMQFKISAGGEIQLPVISALSEAISRESRSAAYKNLSPAGKALIDGYQRTMAAVPAYQKALTGIGRLNKEIIDLELANIPNPTMALGDQQRKLQAFQENVDQGASGLPRMPGIPTLEETRAKFEGQTTLPSSGTPQGASPRLAPPGTRATHIYNPKTGTAFQIPGVMR